MTKSVFWRAAIIIEANAINNGIARRCARPPTAPFAALSTLPAAGELGVSLLARSVSGIFTFMFPTKGKDKLPRTLAYPASAKLISEALANVPQAEHLYITFSSYEASSSCKSAKPFKVISADYSYFKATQFTPHYFEEAGANNPKWSIRVEAVPSAIKNHVTELLQREAFPKMHSWLLARKDITGTERHQRFEVIYNEEMDKLEYKDNPHW